MRVPVVCVVAVVACEVVVLGVVPGVGVWLVIGEVVVVMAGSG